MNWAAQLTRDELLRDMDAFRDNEDFLRVRDSYLRRAVESLDRELAEKLLQAGANPNLAESWGDDLLHFLAHEYYATKTTKGPEIVRLMEMLLMHGADPNHVGANNWRAIDGCMERNQQTLVQLFIKYGADPKQREFL